MSDPLHRDMEVFSEALQLLNITIRDGARYLGAMPYFEECKALCEYRLGNCAEAVEWAQKALTIPGTDVQSHSYVVLAMADWRLGKRAEAGTLLDRGILLAPSIMPRMIGQDLGNKWEAWLYARIQPEKAAAPMRLRLPIENSQGKIRKKGWL